jgi:hypothetical protein
MTVRRPKQRPDMLMMGLLIPYYSTRALKRGGVI